MLCSLYGTGCSPHSCWLPALYLADLQVRFWPPVRWRVLVHGRYRLDHRPLLHHLRPTCKRCHGRSSRSRKYYIELLFIFCKSGDSGEQTVVVLSLLKAFVCVCVYVTSSLKVFLCILMSAGSGKLLRSTKWPNFTQLPPPSVCWWNTDGNHWRSKKLHLLKSQKRGEKLFLSSTNIITLTLTVL